MCDSAYAYKHKKPRKSIFVRSFIEECLVLILFSNFVSYVFVFSSIALLSLTLLVYLCLSCL